MDCGWDRLRASSVGNRLETAMRNLLALIVSVTVGAFLLGSSGYAAIESAAFAGSPNALLKHLAGRWAGAGSILYKNGRSDAFKCVSTFFVNAAGTQMQQNFRCRPQSAGLSAEPGNTLEVKVEWTLEGAALKGTWRETTYELRGSASGEIDGSTIKARLAHDLIDAALSLEVGQCEAVAIVTFSREIERLEATSRKC
jgi:hypothetical protein